MEVLDDGKGEIAVPLLLVGAIGGIELAADDRLPFTGRKVDVGEEAEAVQRVDGHLAGRIEIFFVGSDTPEPDADAGQVALQRQAAAVDRDERMASGRKLVVRLGAAGSARFDLEADIGRARSIGEGFQCDVFDRDACRALLQLRGRTETRREGMFLAVELLARAFEATACSDLRTAETEVDVKAFFDGLVDFVLDYIESRDEGLFAVYASFLDDTFGDRFNADRTAEDDTGFIAFVTRQVAFADADIRLGRLDGQC